MKFPIDGKNRTCSKPPSSYLVTKEKDGKWIWPVWLRNAGVSRIPRKAKKTTDCAAGNRCEMWWESFVKAHEFGLTWYPLRIVWLFTAISPLESNIKTPPDRLMVHFFTVLNVHLTIKKEKRETLSLKPLRPTHCWRVVDLVSFATWVSESIAVFTLAWTEEIAHWESYHSHVLDIMYIYNNIYIKQMYQKYIYCIHTCAFTWGDRY